MKCPICNTNTEVGSFCQKCNWKFGEEDNREEMLEQQYLPRKTTLNGRYRIYRAINSNSEEFPYWTYMAWDTVKEEMITIREFFPGSAERNLDLLTLVGTDGSFESERKKIADAAEKQVKRDENYTDFFEENNTFYQAMEYDYGIKVGKNSDAPSAEKYLESGPVMDGQKNQKSSKVAWILGGVVLALIVLVVFLLVVIGSGETGPKPTQVPKSTTTPVATATKSPTPELKKELTVTLDPTGGSFDGGKTELQSTVVYGELYADAVAAVPTKVGYSFAGWCTEDEFVVDGNTKVESESNQTLYAKWIAETDVKFTLNYYLMDNKGESYELFQTKTEGGEADSSKALFSYATDILGFTYYGANDALGGEQPNEGTFLSEVSIAADGSTAVNLYYDRNQYSVFVNGLLSKSDVSGNGKYYYDSEVTVSCLPAQGYVFEGWDGDGVDASTAETYTFKMPAQDVFLEANVKGKTYKVTFDSQGGTDVKSIKVTYDDYYDFPTAPSKTGYSFDGWYTKASGGTEVSDGGLVSITKDTTLYAHWNEKSGISYTVNHYQEQVSGSGYKLLKSEEKSGKSDEKITLSALAKEYSGFKYVGACAGTKASATPGSYTTSSTVLPNGTRVINLYYDRIEYKVSFDANGGNLSGSSKTVMMGAQIGTLPVPTRDYYSFDGWYTQASGGTLITASYEMGASDMKLFARWTAKKESGWVLASTVPNNATITATKWTYTLTETKETKNSTESGWENTGSYWKETGTGSVKYAAFPYGYDTGHWIYQNYAKEALAAYENDTQKRDVRNEWTNFVYWHWMYNVQYASVTNRAISHRPGSWDSYGNAGKGLSYQYFYAFESAVDCPYLDNLYCCSQNLPSYNCVNVMPDKSSLGTGCNRFFRFDAYTSYYTDYEKIFQYRKVTKGLESMTEVTNGGKISDVVKYVKYKEK